MARGTQQQPAYEPVDASPVKSFFVSMLTRDIKLEEAILDLLDNCVDGILRSKKRRSAQKPYDGFCAGIKYDKDMFEISDNCGGIPWDLHDYAFRMGRSHDRPADPAGAVGVYGIGMKRAIFKMGEECLISTQNDCHRYEVEITREWVRDEKNWQIPVRPAARDMRHDGTTIVVGGLYPGISARFSDDEKAFTSELEQMVATHYAFIIEKGFSVKINGRAVTPRPTRLIFTKKPAGKGAPVIRPFLFKATANDVEVFLAVGFTRPIPSQDEVADDQREKRYSSIDAGWTVVCNDRAVLYCDRNELTGWGEAAVPRYHTQFIAISGIVEFRADDASKLPTTTTKRGIDASSPLYLQVKNKMREGMQVFIEYTNKWKGRAEEAKAHMRAGEPLSFAEIKAEAERLPLRRTRRAVPQGEQYMPRLPLPKRLEPQRRRISFTKEVADVQCVAEYLFNDENADPCAVGEECFDRLLREARK
jgi:hypothetical protein